MKKRILCAIFSILLIMATAVPAFAVEPEPVITLQPQNPIYPENSTAVYSVKVTGSNLMCTWYLEYNGVKYDISSTGAGSQPWQKYAGESFGPSRDGNTFMYSFNGITKGLDGAAIYCVIEDGHYDVTSDKAIINIGGTKLPPSTNVPASVTAYRGDSVDIRCIAKSPGTEQLAYIWYETQTGKLQDVKALSSESEFSDYITCDTSKVGTRYYVCAVETSAGGLAYSSVIPVTVLEKGVTVKAPIITTSSIPNATAGKPYSVKLICSDSNASFSVYYNPGKSNDFNKTGLTLSSSGVISGTPSKAGTYTFTVCASGEGGEGYETYTLTVGAPSTSPTSDSTASTVTDTNDESTQAQTPEVSNSTTDVSAETQTTTVPESATDSNSNQTSGEFPWWGIVIIAVAAAAVAVCVTLLITTKKK